MLCIGNKRIYWIFKICCIICFIFHKMQYSSEFYLCMFKYSFFFLINHDHALRRSSVTVKSLFIVNRSRPRFVIADCSECAAAGLLGARVWVVWCWCRVLPDNAQHNREISMPPVGSCTGDFESWLNGALEVERLSLCEGNLDGGLPCWGPWRIGWKALEMGISFHRGHAGEPGRGLVYQGLWEMDEGGTRKRAFLTEEAQCGWPLGRAPLLGTLEDMLRKVLDTGICLHRSPTGKPGGDSLAGTLWGKRVAYLSSFLGPRGH